MALRVISLKAFHHYAEALSLVREHDV